MQAKLAVANKITCSRFHRNSMKIENNRLVPFLEQLFMPDHLKAMFHIWINIKFLYFMTSEFGNLERGYMSSEHFRYMSSEHFRKAKLFKFDHLQEWGIVNFDYVTDQRYQIRTSEEMRLARFGKVT